MLQALQYTPIQTNLPQATIYTSHCVTGPTSVPNLVFLHGFDSNLLEYRYVFSELVDAPVRAHYVDILGWGLTERPIDAEFSYGPRSKREHLHAFIEHMCGTGALYLVGASVGGAVAIDYALTFPNRVAGLVLVDAQAFIEKKESAMMKIPGMAGIGAEILRSDWLRRLAINLSYENKRFKTDDVLRIGGLHCRMPGWKEAAVDFIKGEGYCVRDKVANINCRTLVIWGENDRVLPKANANKFVDTIHGCQLHFVTECGHSPHIEKPTLLTRHILQFVASAPAN